MEILGIDIGFGFTKATDGRQDLVFKSVLGESTDIQVREEMLAVESEKQEHLQVELDGKSYFLGELAERQSARRALATMCIGVGQGIALALERA